MKIAVYAIAKNEGKHVERWVNSMREADEIFVLDTGSTDDTVEKLRSLGVTVKEHPYSADEFQFDTARNESLAMLPEDVDLCVCTDLDEWFSEGWRAEVERQWIEETAKNPSIVSAEYDYYFAMDDNGNPTARFNQFKIHRPKVASWKYACHEILSYSVPHVVMFIDNIRLYHRQDKGKERGNFYLSLLAKEARNNPTDHRASHYYGRELMYAEKWQEAIIEFTRHLSIPNGWNVERSQSMRFMARCFSNLGKKQDAEYWYTKAVAECRTQREAALEFAEYAANNKDYEVCAFAAKAALEVKNRTSIYVTQEDSWGARPYHLLSVGLSNMADRKWKQASVAASLALRLEPNNENYYWNMIHLNGQSPIYPTEPNAVALHKERDMNPSPLTLPNWDMFDHIYCIHYLGCKEREGRMANEFTRIGLWNHPKFSVWETVRTAWEARLNNNYCAGVTNLALSTLRILLTAKEKGYKRILIWEDDVCMLKDTGLMAEIFESTPQDADIVVYDKMAFVHPPKFAEMCEKCRINKHFAAWDSGIYSGSCYAVNQTAMDALIAHFNEKLDAPDDATQVSGLNKAYSIINTSVQCLYSDSMFPERFGGFNTKNGYAFQGIDYRRYNVPMGYTYDQPVTHEMCMAD